MFSHNKFFITLIACTIANPCFADDFSASFWSGINGSYILPVGFLPLNTRCSKGYYVAKCGDIDLDLNMILGLIQSIDPDGKCWNGDNYTNMHYLLHLEENDKENYKTTFSNTESKILFYNNLVPWKNNENCSTQITELTSLRTKIYETCIKSAITCKKCPNDGITGVDTSKHTHDKTDESTSETTTVVDNYWKNFNTIADCYIVSGSDGKGTFELFSQDDRCYYSYSE